MTTIILTALDEFLTAGWKEFCGDLPFVEIHKGSILDVNCDAVVSPANSYGFMDGGIDTIYSKYFGWHVSKLLQNLIQTKHHGELVVGTAEIVQTDHREIPYLIAAPTMRVPMILKNSVNPYLSARAALSLVKYGRFEIGPHKGEKISDIVTRIAFPGLGTGVGQISPSVCACQMRAAIGDVVLESNSFPVDWVEASERHQKLYTDKIKRLQRESP